MTFGDSLQGSEILACGGGRRPVQAKPSPVSFVSVLRRALRVSGLLLVALAVAGCREVRVKTFEQGTTSLAGVNQVIVVRNANDLGKYGIHAPVHFKGEFGVILLMGPHERTGYKQIVESIRANDNRVRVVAFEQDPADGGQPAPQPYRTYTLWIIPNSVYRRGVRVDVVTPSDEPIATTFLP